ncbi:MAG TPA: ABC transporter permease [Bryobacteraceae bacterium]|nr:ABC transporter permease [Bryobacteraceae bacterium]
MILRFVQESIRRAPRRKALIIAAIAMGSAVATAMLGVMLDIGDKINSELRSEGANIVVTAQAAALTGGVGSFSAGAAGTANYIPESEVPNIKKIFWGLNVTGFSPSLTAQDGALQVEGVWFSHAYNSPNSGTQRTGIGAVNPAWQITRGRWPQDVLNEAIIGSAVARRNGWKPGSEIAVLGAPFKVVGILSSGDTADDRVFVPLGRLQQLTHTPGQVEHIDVAALTKPEDDFARRDPNTLTAQDKERWSCSAYVTSIAYEIEQALPGTVARPVRRVADNEGKILSRVGGLMELITLVALLSAGLTVWSLTAATMVERRGEIAIMQAIGAARWIVATLFGFEIALVGLAGGAIGAGAGVVLAHYVGSSVFKEAINVSWILPFLIVPGAMAIAIAGAAQPLRRALRLEPAEILREGV